MSSKFDISEDDFLISKNSVLILLDQLIEEYSDFTNDVSPKHWRTTGHHITELKKMRDEIRKRIEPLRKPYPKKCVTSIENDAPANHAGEGGVIPTVTLQNTL